MLFIIFQLFHVLKYILFIFSCCCEAFPVSFPSQSDILVTSLPVSFPPPVLSVIPSNSFHHLHYLLSNLNSHLLLSLYNFPSVSPLPASLQHLSPFPVLPTNSSYIPFLPVYLPSLTCPHPPINSNSYTLLSYLPPHIQSLTFPHPLPHHSLFLSFLTCLFASSPFPIPFHINFFLSLIACLFACSH